MRLYGPKLWHSFPVDIKKSINSFSFKCQLKKYSVSSYSTALMKFMENGKLSNDIFLVVFNFLFCFTVMHINV